MTSVPPNVVMVGTSTAIKTVQQDVYYAAKSDAKVLLTGESGTGKEVVAQLIHGQSARARGPFVAMNCAGVPDSLLESELFGHRRGSFTGAERDRTGWLERGHRGTVFMDEVGEMSLRMQALLLRFLETGELQRVGAERPDPPVDVRVVAATNRDLLDRAAAAEFREDLYYRLNVIHIRVPPLRERAGDIPALLDHFLRIFAARYGATVPEVSADALRILTAYHWPGNVRELRNMAERLIVCRRSEVVGAGDLPFEVTRTAPRPRMAQGGTGRTIGLLLDRMGGGESFWSAVYEPFMTRNVKREEVRSVIARGLEQTDGNYKLLVRLFNMPPGDYKRFLNFLHKHDCHMAFQPFRTLPAEGTGVATRTRPSDAPRKTASGT